MGLVLFLVLAPLAQVLLVNRSPWGGPDLVAVAVVWLAQSRGPVWGCVAGFAGGLAADVTPPADGTMGRTALVLAVTGLVAGRWQQGRQPAEWQEGRPPPKARACLVGAACAALGVVLQAGAAVALGDEPWQTAVAALPWTLGWTVALGTAGSAVLAARGRPPGDTAARMAMRRV